MNKQLKPSIIGLAAGVLMILVSVIAFYIVHAPVNSSAVYIVYSIYCTAIIISLLLYQKNNQKASFKECFSRGFQTFIVTTLLMVVYAFIFYKLNPQILEARIIENNQLALLEKTHMPNEIKENADQLRKIFIPMTLMVTAIIYLFLGTLITIVFTVFSQQLKKQD